MSIYIVHDTHVSHIGLGEGILFSLVWQESCSKGMIRSVSCRIILTLYSYILSFITPETWFDFNASILSETHIFSLIFKTGPACTILEEDIHIRSGMSICPPITFFGSRILCTFATSWPYPNIDLVCPCCRHFRLNGDRWCRIISISPSWEVSSILTCYREVSRLRPARFLSLQEEGCHSITPISNT